MVRFTSNGLLDTSFASQGAFDLPFGGLYGVEGIGFQSSGQIIVGFSPYYTAGSACIVRLDSNGTVDTSFGSDGYFLPANVIAPVEIAVEPNNDILLGGTIYDSYGNGIGTTVDQVLPGGTLDPSFGVGGQYELLSTDYGSPAGIAVGPDGNITATQDYDATSSAAGAEASTFRLLGNPPVTGQLVMTQEPPASLAAGSPFGLTVDVEDSSGNLLSAYDGPVTIALGNSPVGATLGGTRTVTASGGVATFSGLTLTTAYSDDSLVAYASGLTDAVTTTIAVSPLAASQLVVTEEPAASITAGSAFGLEAALEDIYGNVETGDNSDVLTLALATNPTGTTLGGTLTATVTQGVATFSGLTLTAADAGYTLGLYADGFSTTTGAFTVTPAAATQVVITEQPPASVVKSAAFGLQATIEDAYGNVVTSAADTVKVALDSNPGGAKLGGTVSVTSSGGVATFSGLTLNKLAAGYTLKVTSSGLTPAVTSGITVTSNTADVILPSPGGTGGSSALLAPLVLDGVEFPGGTWITKRTRPT